MSRMENQLREDRETRDAALAVFEERAARLKRALGERSIPERLTDEARGRAVAVAADGAAVAQENKWVIAGTLLAILAWLARRPLIASAQHLYDRLLRPEPASPWERLRDWTKDKVKS